METIKLEFDATIKSKILEFLSSFSADELKIIKEETYFDENFDENKKKLDVAYSKLKSGNEKTYSIEEADAYLDKLFSSYDH